jgi:PTS system cellobiose-specific IIA component
MLNVNEEEIILNLVVHGGDGKGKALQAIDAAKENEMEKAQELLNQSQEALTKAHQFQTQLIQSSAETENQGVSILLVHGQDHLMTAMLAYDMAVKMVDMYKVFYNNK